MVAFFAYRRVNYDATNKLVLVFSRDDQRSVLTSDLNVAPFSMRFVVSSAVVNRKEIVATGKTVRG